MCLEYMKAKVRSTNLYHKIVGEEGASIPEILVWFAVIFGLTVVFLLFRDEVQAFIESAITETSDLSSSMTTN